MTTNGSAPSTAAEALASADRARTLACRRLRSRSTPERLPSASDRLPPACCWMAMTMAKKRTSGIGMRVIMRSKASPSGTPTRCCSTSSVNSPDTGCGDSRAMIPRHSGSGRPDLTPRTITSMALANSSVNLVWRRLVMRARIQRGRPSAPTKSPSRGTMIGRFGADSQMPAATSDAASDARRSRTSAAIHLESGPLQAQAHGDLFARLLPILQLLQRLGDLAAAVLGGVGLRLHGDASGPGLRHPLDALVGAALAGEVGVHEQEDDGADRQRRQQKQAEQQKIVARHERHPWDCRECRAPRQRTTPAPDAPSRRSTRHVPRSAGGRCRWSDGGR